MKSLTREAMEARVARFDKLQTYQRQDFEAHGIPAGAVEKITARRGAAPLVIRRCHDGINAPRCYLFDRAGWNAVGLEVL